MEFYEDQQYRVVVNHEEQYSIWPDDLENAIGWRDAGLRGTKEECLAHVSKVWTDMRPLSLRKAMEETNTRRAEFCEDLIVSNVVHLHTAPLSTMSMRA